MSHNVLERIMIEGLNLNVISILWMKINSFAILSHMIMSILNYRRLQLFRCWSLFRMRKFSKHLIPKNKNGIGALHFNLCVKMFNQYFLSCLILYMAMQLHLWKGELLSKFIEVICDFEVLIHILNFVYQSVHMLWVLGSNIWKLGGGFDYCMGVEFLCCCSGQDHLMGFNPPKGY